MVQVGQQGSLVGAPLENPWASVSDVLSRESTRSNRRADYGGRPRSGTATWAL